MSSDSRVLVTGGTGYVGGRLIPLLEQRGHRVRCLARRPEFLQSRVGPATEVVAGDVLQPETLVTALRDIETAFYLVHSMGAGKDFEDEDRLAARNFAEAAKQNGVRRIVYLGGLGDEQQSLSKHLRSRQEVGAVLRESGAQLIEFRASIVIGSGSLSFELIRTLVQKLPVMICPKWVSTPAQPIAIEDLLSYLLAAIELPEGSSDIFEIGGPDQVSYGDIMQEYARQRGLKRWMISVPFLSPRLSSLWLGLVTPVYARIGRKLVESLRNPTLVTNTHARDAFSIQPRGVSEAIARCSSTKIGNWPPLAGPMRSVRRVTPSDGEESVLGRGWSILARWKSLPRSERRSLRFNGLADQLAGTTETGCGDCAAGSTCWSGELVCDVDGTMPSSCESAIPSIGGASNHWNRIAVCGCSLR